MGEAILRMFNFSEYAIKGRQQKKTSNSRATKEMKKMFPELYDELNEIDDDEIKAIDEELKQIEKEKDMKNQKVKLYVNQN